MSGSLASGREEMDLEGEMVTLDETTQLESADEKMKMKGNITGTIVVDSKTGLVLSADQDIKMTTEAKGMSMKMKGKTKIKGKARN